MFTAMKVFIIIATVTFSDHSTEQFTTFHETYNYRQCKERGAKLVEEWYKKGATFTHVECVRLDKYA